MWLDFGTDLRPHTINSWKFGTIVEWSEFLLRRGINFEKRRTVHKARAIIDVIYRDKYTNPSNGNWKTIREIDDTEERRSPHKEENVGDDAKPGHFFQADRRNMIVSTTLSPVQEKPDRGNNNPG